MTADTIEAPGPLGDLTSRTRAVATGAHMEPVSGLDGVSAGRDPYALGEEPAPDGSEEPAEDQDTPTQVLRAGSLPPDSLAVRVHNLEEAAEARELHVAELDRATTREAQSSEQQAANVARMARRMIDLEAYALAMARSLAFPPFDVWQAAQARSLTPAADGLQVEPS